MAETATRTANKRRSVGKGTAGKWIKSDIEITLDPEGFGPTAFAARPVGETTGSYDTQEFELDEDRAKFVHFMQPGQNLPKKRLYTVKAMKPNGALIQLPFEPQISNTAGGDREDAIGLRRYQRKGFEVFYNFETSTPLFCAAWGCFAQSQGSGLYKDFCTSGHARVTLPNAFDDAGEVLQGLLSQGATTSRVWGA